MFKLMKHIPYVKINDLEGKFVLIEGLNGSGKTTQAKMIEESLAEEGVMVKYNHEPTSTDLGLFIRQVIEKKAPNLSKEQIMNILTKIFPAGDSRLEIAKSIIEEFGSGYIRNNEEAKKQFLFMVDRLLDVKENILPALKRGGVVIQDRYDISCYLHGMAKGLSFPYLSYRHLRVLGENYIGPNLLIFYWVPVEVALERLKESGKTIDIYENRKTLEEIEKAARWLFSFRFKTPKPNRPLIRKLKKGTQKMKVVIINAEPPIEEVFEESWKYIEELRKKYERMY